LNDSFRFDFEFSGAYPQERRLAVFFQRVHVGAAERAVLYRRDEPIRLMGPGSYWLPAWPLGFRVVIVSVREIRFESPDLDLMIERGMLAGEAILLDLQDHERALLWIDGRFARVLGPGRHVYWNLLQKVRVEVLDARRLRFEHPDLALALASPGSAIFLEQVDVDPGFVALVFADGRLFEMLPPGTHALWRGRGRLRVVKVDQRVQVLDLTGQEVLTSDLVTVRVNLVASFRVTDPLAAFTSVEDYKQALYREVQLALRLAISSRSLDSLLAERQSEQLVAEVEAASKAAVAAFGLEVSAVGLRDLILPGEVRALIHRVTEARKTAEASLVVRREETAAMRSQANTARIFETNPMLLRLRELEVLERVAEKANLQVVLGDPGLRERIVKMV
jgi:regulator of protease activity HflC (stomatin/prohibitin superfamily)